MVSRLLDVSTIIAVTFYQFLGEFCHFHPEVMRPLSLALAVIIAPFLTYRRSRGQASGVELTMGLYLLMATLGFWVLPDSLGRLMAAGGLAMLYTLLSLMAGLGPVLGAEPFTTFYARRTAPREVWETPIFRLINRRLTWFWAALFVLCAVSTLIPEFWPSLHSSFMRLIFTLGIPLALMGGIGVRLNHWYPGFIGKRLAAQPQA